MALGAPLGFVLLRAAITRRRPNLRFVLRELRASPWTYGYLALSTTAVFSAFGRMIGGLEDARRRAERTAIEQREEFTSLVSHDLRDPLQALELEIELLLERTDNDEVRASTASVEKLARITRRMAQVVDDLQDAMQIEVGHVRLQPQPVALPEATAAVLARIRPELGPHPVALRVEGRPRPALVDPARLEQILRVLLDNAARYSWERAPIRVTVSDRAFAVSIAVEDQGVGIPPQELPYLFDRIRQARRAAGEKRGLGVGLYIVRGLVEAHGGRILVDSQVGRGSRFEVLLPAAARAPRGPEGEAASGRAAAPLTVAIARPYMRPTPTTIQRDRTVAEARRALREAAGATLVVVDNGAPVGLFSERELAAAEHGGDVDLDARMVGDRMAPYPFVVSPEAPIEEVARVMAHRHFDVAVVVEGGRAVGLLDAMDVLRALAGLPAR